MAQRAQPAHAEENKQQLSPQETRERKQRVLTKRTPSVVRSIADAIVIKDQDLFFLCAPDGNVPLDERHGYGLYYHDCRFLRTYELRLNGVPPVALGATVAEGDRGSVQLTNPELAHESGRGMPRDTLAIEWSRTLDAGALALADGLTLRN